MEVLLRKDVPKLGRLGEVVKVANGYARNYLLPRKIAVPVTDENLRKIEVGREARRERESEELERVRRQAELMEGFICYVTARVTEQGHLFGSVGVQQVADHLVADGFEGIRSSNISLDRPVQEIGDYEVEVMLHPEVRAHILLRVAGEDEDE